MFTCNKGHQPEPHPEQHRQIVFEIWYIHQSVDDDAGHDSEQWPGRTVVIMFVPEGVPSLPEKKYQHPDKNDQSGETELSPPVEKDIMRILEQLHMPVQLVFRIHRRKPAQASAKHRPIAQQIPGTLPERQPHVTGYVLK